MAHPRQGFGFLTIGAIFFVVFSLMYGGVQLSKGELLPADTTTEAEDDLRAAMWDEIDDRRDARDLKAMPSDRFVRGIAQDTADTFVAEQAATETDDEQPRLSNTRLFCTQVLVEAPYSADSPDRTAALLVDQVGSAGEGEVLYRPPSQFRTGIGIAVEDGTAYAVVRSCEQVDT